MPHSISSTQLAPTRVAMRPARSIWMVAALLVGLLLVAGCTATGGAFPIAGASTAQQDFGGAVASVLEYRLPATPTPVAQDEQLQVIVDTGGSRANIRSAPALDASIIGKADAGDSFDVLGKSDDEAWWQIDYADGNESAWLSDSVVRLAGEEEAVAVTEELLRDDLSASWDVDWSCESEEGRCTVDQCAATISSSVNRNAAGQSIPVEYQVEWDDECFNTDSWVFEVDPFTGRELTGEFTDNFLYAYWLGRNSGEISGVYPFGDDQGVVVSCQAGQTVEIEEGDGWTSAYEGATCHDRRTGMLVYMKYDKRWLFTGEFEGQQYERAFFGDVEHLEQRLNETNLELFFVEQR